MNLQFAQKLSKLALVLAMMFAGSASAATFSIVYDDSNNQMIGTNDIVGTGTFSYDGPIVLGGFSLASLTGISFSATFDSSESFGTADIATNFGTTGIFVYDAGAGNFGMVFSGIGGNISFGSLDLINGAGDILSHEPTDFGIGDPIGCCGGNGMINTYIMDNFRGDYQALSVVPLPAAAWLFGSALMGMGFLRRRNSA